MTKTLKFIIAIIVCFLLHGCKDYKHVIDDYYIYKYTHIDQNGNRTRAENVLMCKMSSENDPFIPNVQLIEFNRQMMIVTTKNGNYVIHGNECGLKCGCINDVIGPFSNLELRDFKDRIKFRAKRKIRL